MRFRIVFYSIFVIAFFGCKSDPTAPAGGNVIMPLALGNNWVYEMKVIDSRGNIRESRLDTTRIIYVGDNDSTKIYFPYLSLFGSSGFANKSDGLWIYTTGELALTVFKLYIPYPIKINTVVPLDTTANRDTIGSLIRSIELLNTDTIITVPAGSFHTLKYRTDRISTFDHQVKEHWVEYYSINVGLIYSEYSYQTLSHPFSLATIESLKSYQLYH